MKLFSFDGVSLFKHLLRNGNNKDQEKEVFEISKVEINDNIATVHFLLKEKNKAAVHQRPLQLRKESGKWKINKVYSIKLLNGSLDTEYRRSGLAQNDYLLSRIETTTGRKPGPEVWKAVK